MKDGHAPDLWHLTIDDLLMPPPETPRLGGSGPFVINLSSSTAPIAIPTEKFPGFEQLRLYQVKRTENNRWRYRLRVGLINTELEADAILAVVRERYPSAFTATAGDDDLKAVSEASRTAQARRAHATEMIADKPEEDAEPARKAAEPRKATATIAKPVATVAKPAAPVSQAPEPTRWIIMQAPEKKTPPPRDEADVDPNAVTDQVAILKLPEDEPAAELILDDVVPPTAPKTEPAKKAEPAKAEAPKAQPPKAPEPPKKVEANKPEPPDATVSPPKFKPRPMKEIEAELRPLFEPTRKAPPAPATVNDLQAIADLVVIDHDDTLESVVLKNNAMVNSLIDTSPASTDAAPVAEPGILETEVPDVMALMAAPMAPPAPAAPPAAVAQPAPVVAPASPIDLVPELTLEVTDLAITPPAAAAPSPAITPPVVIEEELELEELPVLTEAVPVVSKTRASVVESPKQVSEPRATVSALVAKAKATEPVKVVEPPVLTAAVVEPPKKAAEPPTAKAVGPAKVVEPVAKVSEPVKVSAPAPKIVEPAAKVIGAPKAVEPVKVVAPSKVVEAAKVLEPAKVAEAAKIVEPAKATEPAMAAPRSDPAKVIEPVAKTSQPPKVSALVAKAFERAKVEAVAQAAEPAKVVEPVAKSAEPPKVVAPVAKVAEPPKVVEPVAKSAEPASVAEPVAKTAEPAKPVEPPRTVKAQLVAKAGAKSHRAIAKLAKAAAKQSKAINRTTKEIAKATKGQVSKAPHSTVDEKPAEHTQTVAALKPIEPTKSIEQAPPPAAAPVVAQPPKAEQHASKHAARSSKHEAHTAKGASHAPKGSHAHKANGHGGVNGHSRHANGAARDLNGHAHAPKSSPPPPKAAAPAPNGHAHATAKHPAVSGQAQTPTQALNGHSPAAKESAPTANNRVTLATPPVAPTVAKQTVAQPEPAPVQKVVEILSEPLPPVDSTQTIRALTPLELADDDDGSRWYSIQLSLSEDEINPETVPHLDIFDEYRLYSVAGLEQGKFMHALRLGFFTSEGAAQAVAGYLRCYFDEPTVKRVAIAERERFAERRLVARKDIGATGTHTIIELATAPPVPETTLADLSQTGVRRMPEDGSLLSRLFSQLKR